MQHIRGFLALIRHINLRFTFLFSLWATAMMTVNALKIVDFVHYNYALNSPRNSCVTAEKVNFVMLREGCCSTGSIQR